MTEKFNYSHYDCNYELLLFKRAVTEWIAAELQLRSQHVAYYLPSVMMSKNRAKFEKDKERVLNQIRRMKMVEDLVKEDFSND